MLGTVIDIETTGYLKYEVKDGVSLLADTSEILEVGFLVIDLKTRAIYNSGTLYFYKPYFYVESEAQRVHGLTREFLQQYEDQFTNNLIALNALTQSTCIIGKNSQAFDWPFIKSFLYKHGGDDFDIPDLVNSLCMKAYNGGHVLYQNEVFSFDMQSLYKGRFHDLYYEKYGQYLPERKKGSLSEYIDVIPSGQQAVDILYSRLPKDRVTGAHGALYDAVMTYVVYADACNNKCLEVVV